MNSTASNPAAKDELRPTEIDLKVLNPAFDQYFLSVYNDRWPKILKALQMPVDHVLRPNLFYKEGLAVLTHYKMDPASQLVAQALEVQPQDLVLDLCAAPGGKSLILAEALSGAGELISNEFSASRRERLIRVFREYIVQDERKNIFVKGQDGNQFGLKMPEYFDRVLADVPCSGERHLIENKAELKKWTLKRTRNLAVRQFSLLSSAWLACKSGGRIVYSTCSISPLENDAIIEKLLDRRSTQVLRPEWMSQREDVEQTAYGYQVLPDKTGYGPMYFSILQKLN